LETAHTHPPITPPIVTRKPAADMETITHSKVVISVLAFHIS
jgi:hypothetical protein